MPPKPSAVVKPTLKRKPALQLVASGTEKKAPPKVQPRAAPVQQPPSTPPSDDQEETPMQDEQTPSSPEPQSVSAPPPQAMEEQDEPQSVAQSEAVAQSTEPEKVEQESSEATKETVAASAPPAHQPSQAPQEASTAAASEQQVVVAQSGSKALVPVQPTEWALVVRRDSNTEQLYSRCSKDTILVPFAKDTSMLPSFAVRSKDVKLKDLPVMARYDAKSDQLVVHPIPKELEVRSKKTTTPSAIVNSFQIYSSGQTTFEGMKFLTPILRVQEAWTGIRGVRESEERKMNRSKMFNRLALHKDQYVVQFTGGPIPDSLNYKGTAYGNVTYKSPDGTITGHGNSQAVLFIFSMIMRLFEIAERVVFYYNGLQKKKAASPKDYEIKSEFPLADTVAEVGQAAVEFRQKQNGDKPLTSEEKTQIRNHAIQHFLTAFWATKIFWLFGPGKQEIKQLPAYKEKVLCHAEREIERIAADTTLTKEERDAQILELNNEIPTNKHYKVAKAWMTLMVAVAHNPACIGWKAEKGIFKKVEQKKDARGTTTQQPMQPAAAQAQAAPMAAPVAAPVAGAPTDAKVGPDGTAAPVVELDPPLYDVTKADKDLLDLYNGVHPCAPGERWGWRPMPMTVLKRPYPQTALGPGTPVTAILILSFKSTMAPILRIVRVAIFGDTTSIDTASTDNYALLAAEDEELAAESAKLYEMVEMANAVMLG